MLAATRHDDGWGVFDRRPGLGSGATTGRATSSTSRSRSHLAFYRACIAAVTHEDAYAGLMVSMHGAGIYNGRYGTQPSLGLAVPTEHEERGDAFVGEQEASSYRPARPSSGSRTTSAGRTTSSCRCTTACRCHFCLREWERADAEADTVGARAGRLRRGARSSSRLEPLGALAGPDRPVSVRREPGPVHARAQGAAEAPLRGNDELPPRRTSAPAGDRRDHVEA